MKYHDITKNDMKNGSGLRVVLWVAGCSHHCHNCHNPITWDPDNGVDYTDETWDEIEEAMNHDYISGITFSGGDPLYIANRCDILSIIRKVKKRFPAKDIWLYTGYTWNEINLTMQSDDVLKEIISNIDVLVDGRFEEDKKDVTYPWAGSTNQKVIDVQATLNNSEGEVVLYA